MEADVEKRSLCPKSNVTKALVQGMWKPVHKKAKLENEEDPRLDVCQCVDVNGGWV